MFFYCFIVTNHTLKLFILRIQIVVFSQGGKIAFAIKYQSYKTIVFIFKVIYLGDNFMVDSNKV